MQIIDLNILIFFLAFSFEKTGLVHCEELNSKHLSMQTTKFGLIISIKQQNNLCIIQQ